MNPVHDLLSWNYRSIPPMSTSEPFADGSLRTPRVSAQFFTNLDGLTVPDEEAMSPHVFRYVSGKFVVDGGSPSNRYPRASVATVWKEVQQMEKNMTETRADWLGAQLLHYGLPFTRDPYLALGRLAHVMLNGGLMVPLYIRRIELQIRAHHALIPAGVNAQGLPVTRVDVQEKNKNKWLGQELVTGKRHERDLANNEASSSKSLNHPGEANPMTKSASSKKRKSETADVEQDGLRPRKSSLKTVSTSQHSQDESFNHLVRPLLRQSKRQRRQDGATGTAKRIFVHASSTELAISAHIYPIDPISGTYNIHFDFRKRDPSFPIRKLGHRLEISNEEKDQVWGKLVFNNIMIAFWSAEKIERYTDEYVPIHWRAAKFGTGTKWRSQHCADSFIAFFGNGTVAGNIALGSGVPFRGYRSMNCAMADFKKTWVIRGAWNLLG